MTAKKINTEDQRLGCKVGGEFTLEELLKRANATPYEPTLEVVKKDED
jgi:hypothetical protein